MTLIAFDVELSRANRRASEKVIAAMRLQWWRDVVAEACDGAEPRAHEVAGPLADLIRSVPLPAAAFEPIIAGYERELTSPFSADEYDFWAEERFVGLLHLAAWLVGCADHAALAPAGRAMALSFALRHARAMAGEGVFLLPLPGLERGALSRGETTDTMRAMISGRADDALDALRKHRAGVPRRLKPVLRLGWRSAPVLKHALKPGLDLARDFVEPPGRGTLRLLQLSLTGRW